MEPQLVEKSFYNRISKNGKSTTEKGRKRLKRKTADFRNWKKILKKKVYVDKVSNSLFEGYLSFVYIEQITEPQWDSFFPRKEKVADSGYLWLQHFPKDRKYVITTMFNDKEEIVQHYVDICYDHGIEDSGIPWYLDLYLDIVLLPTGEAILVDEDELDEALKEKVIDKKQYDLAYSEANSIFEEIEKYHRLWNEWCQAHWPIWEKVKDKL